MGEGLRESKMGRRLIFWMFFSALGLAIGPAAAVRLFGHLEDIFQWAKSNKGKLEKEKLNFKN